MHNHAPVIVLCHELDGSRRGLPQTSLTPFDLDNASKTFLHAPTTNVAMARNLACKHMLHKHRQMSGHSCDRLAPLSHARHLRRASHPSNSCDDQKHAAPLRVGDRKFCENTIFVDGLPPRTSSGNIWQKRVLPRETTALGLHTMLAEVRTLQRMTRAERTRCGCQPLAKQMPDRSGLVSGLRS